MCAAVLIEGLPCLYFSGLVGGNFEVGSCFAALGQIWGQSANRSVNSCFACLGERGWGLGGVATVQTGAVQSPDWGEKGGWNQNGQPPNQPTRPLVIWPKFTGPRPCALLNLNNFAKANKAFCRFWCLGLRDANIGGVAF